MNVGEVCNREVVFAHAQDSVLNAAQLMREHHVGDVVLVEERQGRRVPVGILTDRDIAVEIVAEEVDPATLTLADAVISPLQTVTEAEGVMETVKRMRDAGVRRMPVVDAEGALVGILAADDVLELMAEGVSDLVALVAREQRRERRTRTA